MFLDKAGRYKILKQVVTCNSRLKPDLNISYAILIVPLIPKYLKLAICFK
jgi:hypothetical protein